MSCTLYTSLVVVLTLQAGALRSQISSEAAKVLLPAVRKRDSIINYFIYMQVICQAFLDRLEKRGFNIYDPKLSIRDSLLPVKLWWKSWKGVYRQNIPQAQDLGLYPCMCYCLDKRKPQDATFRLDLSLNAQTCSGVSPMKLNQPFCRMIRDQSTLESK